jgi:serine/threonine protein kinase
VDRNFDVRLIDFGATSFLHQRGTQESFIGTMHYASPEILLGTLHVGAGIAADRAAF